MSEWMDRLIWPEEMQPFCGVEICMLTFCLILGSAQWDILPEGTRSLFVQPLVQNINESQRMDGFLLVASTAGYAYSDKDRAWIGAIAEKFRG